MLPSTSTTRVGTILTAAPSSQLPGGLFDKVTGVSHSDGGTVVTLVPAHLADAFPELGINTRVAFSPAGINLRRPTWEFPSRSPSSMSSCAPWTHNLRRCPKSPQSPPPASAHGTPSLFAPIGSPPQVKNPGIVLTRDVNGDGHPDLIVGDYVDNTVSIFLGNGQGGFTQSPQSTVSLGATVDAIAAGDFNGDGRPDLAIANGASGTVTGLLGDGHGAFTAAGSAITVGGTARALAVGDFNRDGHDDMAVSTGPAIVVLSGNGTGGFTPAPGSPITSVPYVNGLTVGNFGGAGPDLGAYELRDGEVHGGTQLSGCGRRAELVPGRSPGVHPRRHLSR